MLYYLSTAHNWIDIGFGLYVAGGLAYLLYAALFFPSEVFALPSSTDKVKERRSLNSSASDQ